MDQVNLRVLIKEPRGFVRILQVLFSILAWSTTSGFSTTSRLHIACPDAALFPVDYNISYPFDFRQNEVSAPLNCTDDTQVITDVFPIDFSATAMLYVLICVVSLLYASASLVYYCFLTAKYENDPLAPMVDLCITIVLTFLWIILTCTWALNVSDLKHYTHPHYFKEYLTVCKDPDARCETIFPGKWSALTVSIVCGFTCVVLWLGSTWYIFKETSLHKKQTSYQTQAGQPVGQQQQQQQQLQQQHM